MVNEIIENAERDVRTFLKEEGTDKFEVEVEGQTESGDNYMSEIIFIKVKTQDNKDLNLVVKKSKQNEVIREKAASAYIREIFMYTKVFPTYRKFIQENNADIKFDFVPKVYWSSLQDKNETLIFENLKCVGYELHDRSKPWNMDHSLLVMEHYGKLHGMSLAIKIKQPDLFKELTKDFRNLYHDFVKSIDVTAFYSAPLREAMEGIKEAGRSDLLPKFDEILENIVAILEKEPEEKDKIVITHGDCWNNNFLFKYQGGKPTKMSFVDFQISSAHSPVFDLCYNIYATCDNVCLNNFDLLLKTYYESLSKTIGDLGCDLTEVFSYEQFMEHWKKYSRITVLLVPVILKIALVSKEDAPNFDDVTDSSYSDKFDVVVANKKEYTRRVTESLIHYVETFL